MSVVASDATWYDIRIGWDGMFFRVKDRYSNLEQLYNKYTDQVPAKRGDAAAFGDLN